MIHNLAKAQRAMKRRQSAKTAQATLRPMGRGSRAISKRGDKSRGPAGGSGRSEDNRRVHSSPPPHGDKYCDYVLKRKDLIAAKTIIDAEFLTNIRNGKDAPPEGEPWVYFIFATLVTTHRGKRRDRELKTRYVIELEGPSREDVDEQLLELVTRPGIECPGLEVAA